ncbi:MAG: phosphate--AMP phosphotransferase [Methanimicrococcus sp.]|nr:phosphate--AMP phosphotransferase [Methanimicrococcus sp.]
MLLERKPEIPAGRNINDLIKESCNELGILQREARLLDLPVIIVFEGWYDVFIGELINRLLLPLDSRGFDFYYTDMPTAEESKKPFIIRFNQRIPPKGKIAIFDRSWYMRGLIEHLLNESEFFGCFCPLIKSSLETILTEPAKKDVIHTDKFKILINTINDFEKTLTDNGTFIIKIYFGAKKEKRMESRKMWNSILPYDMDTRSAEKIYKKDIDVLKEMLEQTNKENAPWDLYFADRDIDVAVLRTMKIITERLKSAVFTAKAEQIEAETATVTEKREDERKDKTNITAAFTPAPAKDHLGAVDLTKSYSKKEYEKKIKKYQKRMSLANYSLHHNKKPLVLIFEGWDAAGKGGAIKRIVQSINPRNYRVIPIGAPTDTDKKYHYLWRFLNGIPDCGNTSVYDRSWYGRVMVERVEGFCTEEEWKRAYREINDFEKSLTNAGMVVIKFWLHISKEKQEERFNARAADPLKQWKLTDEDWRNRGKWDQYYEAVNEMIDKTSTEKAPWVIVEANDKYYARIKILKTVSEIIEKELAENRK